MFKKIKNSKNTGFTPTPSLTLLLSFLVKFLRNSNHIIKTFFTSFTKRSNKKTMSNWVSGFTLIELLVVIAIIGVLAAVVLSSLNTVRTKSRDARRKMDIRQIEKALELHYDKHGSYTQPEGCSTDTSYSSGEASPCGTASNDWASGSDLRRLITDGFMSSLPKDPINNATYKYDYEVWNTNQAYAGCPAGQQYDLCATLEAGGTFCVSKR